MLPSLSTLYSQRPGFPKGLRVLLLDGDQRSRAEVETQLKECGYSPTVCKTCAEAAAALSSTDYGFDVVLADVRNVMQKVAGAAAIVASGKRLPLVLMSSRSNPNDVMNSIRLGAQDILEKPLALTKVKAIWQHTVRRMMKTGDEPPKPLIRAAGDSSKLGSKANKGASSASRANKEHSSSKDAQSGQGESGSNSSSSDRAHGANRPGSESAAAAFDDDHDDDGLDPLFGLDPLAFADLADVDAEVDVDSPLAGLADGFSHLLMGEQSDTGMLPLAGPGPSSLAAADMFGFSGLANFTMGTGSRQTASNSAARRRSHDVRRRSHDVRNHASAATAASPRDRPRRASSGSMAGSGSHQDPVMGHSCGQLPPLPVDMPGMAWGLPTNPLQITPKLGPMPPHSMMMAPMPWGMQMPAGAMMQGGPMSAMASMFQTPHMSAATAAVSGPGMLGSMSLLGACKEHMPGMHHAASMPVLPVEPLHSMLRAGSAPVLDLHSPHGLGVACDSALDALCGSGADAEPHSLSCPPSPDMLLGMDLEALDLLEGMGMGMAPGCGSPNGAKLQPLASMRGSEESETGGRQGPLGLQLKKTPSLIDMIAEQLRHHTASPAFESALL